ncbi:MAG: LPXTG cell wall anchor domain-containing protein, partial [Microbacteriaceae bacterium]
SAASNSITFDLVFASCLTGVSALPCADSATGKGTLANTGVDTSSMIALGLGAAVLAALGVVLVVVRRRRA